MRSSSSGVDTFGAVRLIPRHGMPSLPRPVVAWIVAGAERISYHQLCCNEYRSNESNQIEKAVCREASTCDLVTSYSSSEITPLMAEDCPLLPQIPLCGTRDSMIRRSACSSRQSLRRGADHRRVNATLPLRSYSKSIQCRDSS